MNYEVRLKKRAIKSLQALPEPYYTRITSAIYSLAQDPRPSGCKKPKGRDAYRIRVADYRIIYEINDDVLLVEVIDLGNRKDIYNQ